MLFAATMLGESNIIESVGDESLLANFDECKYPNKYFGLLTGLHISRNEADDMILKIQTDKVESEKTVSLLRIATDPDKIDTNKLADILGKAAMYGRLGMFLVEKVERLNDHNDFRCIGKVFIMFEKD